MTVPPAEETVLAPDSDVAVVELLPPGDEVDVEEPPGTVVDTGRLELVDESGVVDEDDEFGLTVEVVALITGAPGESLTSSEAAPTTAQVAVVTRIVAASQPSA
ncbi:MAG TPA: hypothetical protein VIW94_02105 [Acidimicrobiia bacterium]